MILRVTIQKQNSEQLLPKVSTEAFCKIDFLKNFQVGKHLCWTLFPIKLLAKRQATLLKRDSNAGIFLTIAKFLRAAFFIEHLRWLFLSVWWSHCSVLGICRHSLLNQKHNVWWFLLKGVADIVRVSSFHIISRNHSNAFLLINLQKTKTCSK